MGKPRNQVVAPETDVVMILSEMVMIVYLMFHGTFLESGAQHFPVGHDKKGFYGQGEWNDCGGFSCLHNVPVPISD